MSPEPTYAELMLKFEDLLQENKILKEKLEFLENAQETTQEGLWAFDSGGGTWKFNAKCYTLLGYEPGGFPADYNGWLTMLHPDDKTAAVNGLGKVFEASQHAFSLTFRMRAADGRWRWILFCGKADSRDAAGNVTRVFGSMLDITENKYLRDSLHLARFIYDKAPIGVYRFDRTAKILDVNDKAADMIGYSREELVSMTLFDIDPTIDAVMDTDEWQRRVELRTLYIESVHRHKDGSDIPVSITTNFLDYGGQQFAISFVEDITIRKQREQALIESESHLKITLNSIGDAIITTDKAGLIRSMNPMAEKFTGYSVDSAKGRPLQDVFHIVSGDTRCLLANQAEKVMVTGDSITLANATLLIAKDGTEYQVAGSGAPILQPDGNITGVVLVFRDVTKAFLQEERIRKNEQRLSDLISNVPGVMYQAIITDPNDIQSIRFSTVIREKAGEIFELDPETDSFINDFIARLPERDRPRFVESVLEAAQAGKHWHYEGQFSKSSGQKIWFEGNSISIQVDDDIVYYGFIADITQRKEMETSLRLSQFIFDKAGIAIFILGENGRFMNVNEETCRYLGYSREELLRMDVFDLNPNITVERWEAITDELRTHGLLNQETVNYHKNGTIIPVQVIDNIMHFEDQEFHVAFVQDISERKRMELELRENEQRLDLALEGANEGIWDWRIDEDTVYHDSRYFTMAGYEPYEFESSVEGGLGYLHETDLAKVKKVLAEYLAGERESSDLEYRFLRKDGSYMWLHAKGRVVSRDSLGKPVRVLGTHTDITQQKKLEESLRITQSIVDKAPIGIWRMGNNGEILDINEQAYTSLGYTREELCSLTVFDFDPDMTPESWEKRKDQFDRKSRILVSEGRHKRKNGEIFPVLITSKIMELGDLKYRIAFVQDITKIKRTEDALLQSRKMEAIGTLAGGIAHDFNNILSAILGYAQLAQLNCPEHEKIQNYLSRILEASNRAKDLVTQILDFSRHRSSGKKPVEISSICREALKLIRASIPADIEIREFLGTSQAVINADASQIHQVVLNLCTNAAYAMRKEGGQLVLELLPIEIGPDDHLAFPTLPAGNYLQLTIADTGSGISETIISRIFEPYFTTKKEGEGTGMGLATVHGIVKNHGGEIRVYSEPGVGTTFHVLFPATENAPVAFDESTPPLSVTGNERILIIDDEYFIVDIGREMLSRHGYLVEIETDPIEALNMFRDRSDQYDLVITDWTMPKMNGEELIRELRIARPEIPIILCTGYNKRLVTSMPC